ncbi:hypothetical protein I0D68_13155 [Pseudomonas lalucatii]|nr:hypothetical protein I0D68_13155 [Pseudomonas lalucatii]
MRLPPLRERGGDCLLIARKLLQDICARENKAFQGFSKEVEAIMRAYPWPGNVRELENVIMNMVVLGEGEQLTVEMLPESLHAILQKGWWTRRARAPRPARVRPPPPRNARTRRSAPVAGGEAHHRARHRHLRRQLAEGGGAAGGQCLDPVPQAPGLGKGGGGRGAWLNAQQFALHFAKQIA